MITPHQSRSLVATPIMNGLISADIDIDTLADKMKTRKKYLSDVLAGTRSASLEWYHAMASCVGMEISLVPKHLIRAAYLETAPAVLGKVEPSAVRIDKKMRDQMKLLRNHRIEAGLDLNDISKVVGNATASFRQYQSGYLSNNFPALETLQKYADLLNLAFVAVDKGSVYANNKMAKYAKGVSFLRKEDNTPDFPIDDIDDVLAQLVEANRQKPDEYATRFRTMTEIGEMLQSLSPIDEPASMRVYMPKSFAKKLQALMDKARDQGLERIPYAKVVKPWGDPKSWAHFKVKDMFFDFYRAVEALALRSDAKASSLAEALGSRSHDLPLRDMFDILRQSGIVLSCEIPSLKATFAIHNAVELGYVMTRLMSDRPLKPVAQDTLMGSPTIQSLMAHPEKNRMSSAFRLFKHFGISVSAKAADVVYDAELVAEGKTPKARSTV